MSSLPHLTHLLLQDKKEKGGKRGFNLGFQRQSLYEQLDYMTDSDRTPLASSPPSLKSRLEMSGERSGAGANVSSSERTSLSSTAPLCLACRSTKNCSSPAPKASPSTFSMVQVRSLWADGEGVEEKNWTKSSTLSQRSGTHTSQSTARMREMSLVGSPTASRMMARVNTPPAGIPAAPTLEAVAVTLTLQKEGERVS